ncbi:hypothetical protein HK102_008752 [Quaeritorhiza haematococci]|nr:hypothetical protein HK102_008752 [Quaeritorhiza haematococci]
MRRYMRQPPMRQSARLQQPAEIDDNLELVISDNLSGSASYTNTSASFPRTGSSSTGQEARRSAPSLKTLRERQATLLRFLTHQESALRAAKSLLNSQLAALRDEEAVLTTIVHLCSQSETELEQVNGEHHYHQQHPSSALMSSLGDFPLENDDTTGASLLGDASLLADHGSTTMNHSTTLDDDLLAAYLASDDDLLDVFLQNCRHSSQNADVASDTPAHPSSSSSLSTQPQTPTTEVDNGAPILSHLNRWIEGDEEFYDDDASDYDYEEDYGDDDVAVDVSEEGEGGGTESSSGGGETESGANNTNNTGDDVSDEKSLELLRAFLARVQKDREK